MANVQTCIGVKATGVVCGARCRGENTRCATHQRILESTGPNALALKELGYVHKKHIKDIKRRYEALIIEAQNDQQIDHLEEDQINEIRVLRANQQVETTQLIRRQQEEIQRTGVDPDAPARERARVQEEQRRELRRIHFEHLHRHGLLGPNVGVEDALAQFNNAQNQQLNRGAQIANHMVRPAAEVRELALFAQDAQNVHTTAAVQRTKDMVARILNIVVPNDYKWNTQVCSKTPGEIIIACGLTPTAAWQMSSKYCQPENIYELGNGIYGKVLDGVWQYIANSPDKTDLCRILRQEMEDNIGMCAQGNLTRLCNILSGYMEGIGVQESPAEILGRKLPTLMQIEDLSERLKEAEKLFREISLPKDDWLKWLEPLVDGEEEFEDMELRIRERDGVIYITCT